MSKPNCHKCIHCDPLPMTHQIQCLEPRALVSADGNGATSNQFDWPWRFDPAWLEECDAYEEKKS